MEGLIQIHSKSEQEIEIMLASSNLEVRKSGSTITSRDMYAKEIFSLNFDYFLIDELRMSSINHSYELQVLLRNMSQILIYLKKFWSFMGAGGQ